MTTYVWRDGELIDKAIASPCFGRGPRSSLARPYVISDAIGDLRGHADGKIYDSKSALRASYKRHGYTEIGTDAPLSTGRRRPDVRTDLREAVQKVKAGYKPAPLEKGVMPQDAI